MDAIMVAALGMLVGNLRMSWIRLGSQSARNISRGKLRLMPFIANPKRWFPWMLDLIKPKDTLPAKQHYAFSASLRASQKC